MSLTQEVERLLQPAPGLDLRGYATVAAWQHHVTARQVRAVERTLRDHRAEGPGRSQACADPSSNRPHRRD